MLLAALAGARSTRWQRTGEALHEGRECVRENHRDTGTNTNKRRDRQRATERVERGDVADGRGSQRREEERSRGESGRAGERGSLMALI
eukprot:2660498-Rhodomonas_salina.1